MASSAGEGTAVTTNWKNWYAAIRQAPWIAPLGLVKLAALLSLIYLMLAVAGGREYASFLSGTRPGGESSEWLLLFGLLYVLAYFGFVLAVPVLLLGACVFGMWQLASSMRR
jgi:hypothetical protein